MSDYSFEITIPNENVIMAANRLIENFSNKLRLTKKDVKFFEKQFREYWMNYGKITINTKTGKQKKLTKLAEFLEFKGKDPGLANPCIRTNRDNGESHDG